MMLVMSQMLFDGAILKSEINLNWIDENTAVGSDGTYKYPSLSLNFNSNSRTKIITNLINYML